MEILGEHKYDAHQCMHTAIQTWISFIGSYKVESGALILYNNMFIKLQTSWDILRIVKKWKCYLADVTFWIWESREIKPKLEKKNSFTLGAKNDISDLWVLQRSTMCKTVWAVN